MFVRRRRNVREQEFPEDLEALGLFITEKDTVRQIAKPDERFEYRVFKDERLNDRRREAVTGCYRRLALDRLTALGLRPLKLTNPTHHTHITILHSHDLPTNNSRVLLLFPDENTDLGIWSTRPIDGENGHIGTGTMESIVRRGLEEGYSIIIANTGALIFSPEADTTVTSYTFASRNQKPWNLGGRIRNYDPTWNVVKGSEDPAAHVQTVFERVVRPLVPRSAKIFVIAAGTAAGGVAQYLDQNYTSSWAPQLYACAFAEPTYSISSLSSPPLKRFLNTRCRAYIVHDDPRGVQVPDGRFGCAAYSAETSMAECVAPLCQEGVMEYFGRAWEDPEAANPGVVVVENLVAEHGGEEGVREAMEGVRAKGGLHAWGDGSTPGCGW